jgi:hypothetical protein
MAELWIRLKYIIPSGIAGSNCVKNITTIPAFRAPFQAKEFAEKNVYMKWQ